LKKTALKRPFGGVFYVFGTDALLRMEVVPEGRADKRDFAWIMLRFVDITSP
jgi:hypothetical protein